MDVQTGLVCVAVVVVSAVVIFVISMFGMKEKTYEEAIAEQRNMPEENLLLGRSGKDKMKDKKQKKVGKKVKEKPEREKSKQSDVVPPVLAPSVPQDKNRVDFEEPEAEVVSDRPSQEERKKKKKEKVKPILLNKHEPSLVVETPPAPANHFEEIQPKDSLLLKHKGSKDDLNLKNAETAVVETVIETSAAPEKAPKPSNPKGEKKMEKVVEKVTVSLVQHDLAIPLPQANPPPKERSKKKKSELATLQQMSGDREGVNVNLLVPLVRKAELSRSEIQILIDLLLNKQQNSAVGNSEWIEGRQDPVVKLKKHLAEKEKSLQEEQEASQSLQSKLKELRNELNSERSRLTHSYRQVEETLVTKQNELQALAARLQHTCESHIAEKQALTQQNQQLQAQLNEDHLLLRKLQEEQGQAQGVLQQELHNQRQQLELHIAHLTETNQEAEAAFKTQIAQLHSQLQEQETVSASLNTDLQELRETQMEREEENKILREQITHLETEIRHFESQVAHFKDSSDRTQELARQNEELLRIKTELEHHVNNARQHEVALKFESKNLHEEVDGLKEKCANYSELKNEANRLKLENEQLIEQIAKVNELQLDSQRLQEENENLLSQMSSFSQLEMEAQQLREENESLAAQVTAMTDRPAAEGRENGDLQYSEEKETSTKDDLSQLNNIVKEKELLLDKLNEELKQKESCIEKLNFDINEYKTEISKIREELELQKRKNNEISTQVRKEEQSATKQLLQRIFPEIRIEEKDYEAWLGKFESLALSSLSQQKAQVSVNPVSEDHSAVLIEVEKQNSQLQAMVTHYKTIIEETEGMLNKLQNHVEQAEANWRQQLQLKETELEAVREERDHLEQSLEQYQSTGEMQSKLQELQKKLQAEETEKRELYCKYKEVQNSCDQLKDQVSSYEEQHHTGTSMKEETDNLTSDLKTEQEKNQDLMREIVKLKSLVQIGQDSLSQEQQLVQQLQQQLDKLNVVNQSHSVATNGPSTEPSITEGGSGKK